MRCYRLLLSLLLQLSALVLAVPAQAAPTNIAAELIVEPGAVPGQTVLLALHMRPGAGWHGYWSNPGDAGLGMALAWRLPKGFVAGEPRYPAPQTLVISGLMNHVYERDYAVLVPLTLSKDAVPGSRLAISVSADWLACTDKICVPEHADLATELTVASAAALPDPRFDQWRRALPAPLGAAARFAIDGTRLRIAIPLPDSVALRDPHLFVGQDKVVDYAAVQTYSKGDNLLVVDIPRAKFAAITPKQVSAVLVLKRGGVEGLAIEAVPGAVPELPVKLRSESQGPAMAFSLLLLSALAGGLLLNIMPCVFPILSLKALSLAKAGGEEAKARREGLAYSAGVVLACTALGALLLTLRAGGSELGWAFQLQQPLVVAALLLLATALTANFLGFFEFSVPGFAQGGGSKGAFATGLLAAFAATPCTGPFMAAAMGAALVLPVAKGLALFATLGLGIALPFLAIAFVPALRRRLPKPGQWMVRFRRWMALPMGLTALALLWLASRVGGSSFWISCVVLVLLLVLLLSFGGWLQKQGKPATVPLAVGLGVLLATAAIGLPLAVKAPGGAAESILASQPFSEAALTKARASAKPVFLYFTADWCVTCKINERVAIEREATRDAFAKAGVEVLTGDWTRNDPAITRFLTAQGVAGVPLYLWYPAGGGAAQQLPQVLGPDALVKLAGK